MMNIFEFDAALDQELDQELRYFLGEEEDAQEESIFEKNIHLENLREDTEYELHSWDPEVEEFAEEDNVHEEAWSNTVISLITHQEFLEAQQKRLFRELEKNILNPEQDIRQTAGRVLEILAEMKQVATLLDLLPSRDASQLILEKLEKLNKEI